VCGDRGKMGEDERCGGANGFHVQHKGKVTGNFSDVGFGFSVSLEILSIS